MIKYNLIKFVYIIHTKMMSCIKILNIIICVIESHQVNKYNKGVVSVYLEQRLCFSLLKRCDCLYKALGIRKESDMNKEEMYRKMDEKASDFEQLANAVWEYAEVNYVEYKSVASEIECLKKAGFRINEKAAGVDTAFTAEYGEGKPVIAILGEYDALDGLSQVEDVDYPCTKEGMTTGHGCGHNLLGTAAVEAAIGVAEYLKANKCSGTVKYCGTPAEEGGGGKIYMIKGGCFDDVDVAISWHPANKSRTMGGSLATVTTLFEFQGIASHAAGAPEKGRSALDAAELTNVGVQFLREHVSDDVRIHYAFHDVGGKRPNIVQSSSSVYYVVRALDMKNVKDVYRRVCKIAEGAAMMTETKLLPNKVYNSYTNIIPNDVLTKVLIDNSEDIYPIDFTEEEREYARKYNIAVADDALKTYSAEFDKTVSPFSGSTDFGDVSWVVPSIGFDGCTYAADTVAHSWAWTAQGKSSGAHKGMHAAAKLMSGVAIDLIEDASLVEAAKKEFDTRMEGRHYESLRPTDMPPANMYK